MDTDIIYPIIRRNNRNWLIFLLIVFGLICLTITMSLNTFDNALHGPYEVTQENVIDIQDLNDVKNYYVTITGDQVTDSGFQYVTDSNTVEKSYMLLRLNNKLLLVELMGDVSRDIEYTGTLVPFGSEIQREVVDKLNDYPAYKKALLPFMLKTYDFVVPAYLSMIILLLLGVICLWRIIIVLLNISDTSRHKIIRNLKRFGEPDTLIPQIERELAADHIKVGKTIHLTTHWLVQSTSSSFKATPLSDLMWIYKQVIQHRTYGIPVGKTYTALIYDRYGKTSSVRGKEDLISKVLANVAAHAPWVKMGFTKELQTAWKKDRAGFIAAVDQRKQQSNQ